MYPLRTNTSRHESGNLEISATPPSRRLNVGRRRPARRAASWLCFQSSESTRGRRSPGMILQTPRRPGSSSTRAGHAARSRPRPWRRWSMPAEAHQASPPPPAISSSPAIDRRRKPATRNAPAITARNQRSPSQFSRPSARSQTLSSLLWSSRFIGIRYLRRARVQRRCPNDLVRLGSRQNGWQVAGAAGFPDGIRYRSLSASIRFLTC